MTHDDLVKLAAKWLTKKHSVVITEMATTGEEPDAIGWNSGGGSTLIECKASRQDFERDADKWFRRNAWQGMGQLRYYLAPLDMINPSELPAGWGLLETNGRKVLTRIQAQPAPEHNQHRELALLVSALRRCGPLAPKGCSVRFYTIEGRNRATLGVEAEAATQKWKPVAESPPPMDTPCWLWDGKKIWIGGRGMIDSEQWLWGNAYSSIWHNGVKWDADNEADDDYQPTHWLPLPQPPEGA